MRPDQPLPVRPAVIDGEALSGYAARLADANGLHPSSLLPRGYVDSVAPSGMVTRLATAAGMSAAQVESMTLAPMPVSVRGRGKRLRHGWRLHQDVTWVCPVCTDQTGYRALLWRLALMPLCTRCGVLLVQDFEIPSARPAPTPLLDLTVVLAELVRTSVDVPRSREVLYRLRRRCQSLAATVEPHDPPAAAGLPPVSIWDARNWGPHPVTDPATMATLLLTAGGSLVPRAKRSATGNRASEFTTADRDRLEWFLTQLRRHVVRHGLAPDHVPTTLPQVINGQRQTRRPGQWLSLTRAAAALYMVIARAHGQDDTPTTALKALGVPDIRTCLLIDAIDAGRGLRAYDANRLSVALQVLLGDGLVDYQHRRDTLRAVTRLPRRATHRLRAPLPGTVGHPAGRLALGWIWTRFTHGPMRSSRWPQIPDRDVHAFDAALNPEMRLLLHEIGIELLTDAALQPTYSTPATVDALLLTGPTNRADRRDRKETIG